ncbi:MAG TPA: VOC family protein, partial [Miltoncostaeaceae bacterium]|nr:VOC family protein [Miltoncostaeaceae bacterium]
MSDDPAGAVGWVRALVFEAEDLGRAAGFWQALLGVEMIDRRDDWIQLGRDRGGVYLGFLPAQGERPSAIRARPDVQVPDLDAATARIERLGGRLLSIDKDPEGEHRVMADTEGNEFTILGPLPQDEA